MQGTKDYLLTYRRLGDFIVIGYLDSDFVVYSNDHKSTSKYIFMMEKRAVSQKGNKHSITTTSTMEAKYVTCYEATREAIWLRNLIEVLRNLIEVFLVIDSISKFLNIFYDNIAIVNFS